MSKYACTKRELASSVASQPLIQALEGFTKAGKNSISGAYVLMVFQRLAILSVPWAEETYTHRLY